MEQSTPTLSCDSYAIEKSFREKRKITTPEFGIIPSRKGKPAVDNLRLVLQNWHNPKGIDKKVLKRQAVYEWRWRVNKYLKGDESKVCERLKPLIEEYREFLLDESKKEEVQIMAPVYNHRKGQVSDKVLDQWRKVLDNWECPQALTIDDIGSASLKKYRTKICKILKGKEVELPEKVRALIEKYKKFLTLPSRVKNTEVKISNSSKKLRTRSINTKVDTDKLQCIIDNWDTPEEIDNNYISKKMVSRYRSRVYQFIRGGYKGIPKAHLEILKANQDKFKNTPLYNRPVKYTTNVDTLTQRQKVYNKKIKTEQAIKEAQKRYNKQLEQQKEIEKALYPEITEKQIQEIKDQQSTLTEQDKFVSIMSELRKLGITELTVKFQEGK